MIYYDILTGTMQYFQVLINTICFYLHYYINPNSTRIQSNEMKQSTVTTAKIFISYNLYHN